MAGNYYNFYAATAGTGNPNLTSGDAPDSICPSGWHLPSSTGTSSYTTLVQNYVGREENTDNLTNHHSPLLLSTLSFTRSGFYTYYNGILYSQSSHGYYWSHTPNGKTRAYYLTFVSTGLYPRSNYSRGYGFTLRCLAR